MVGAVRTAAVEEDNAPVEETALEKAVLALTILSKKKLHGRETAAGAVVDKGVARGATKEAKILPYCNLHFVFREILRNLENENFRAHPNPIPSSSSPHTYTLVTLHYTLHKLIGERDGEGGARQPLQCNII